MQRAEDRMTAVQQQGFTGAVHQRSELTDAKLEMDEAKATRVTNEDGSEDAKRAETKLEDAEVASSYGAWEWELLLTHC